MTKFDFSQMFNFFTGNTSDIFAFVSKYDPDKKARRALDGLKPLHIRVALTIIFVEAMTTFLEELSARLNHTVYLRKMHERCLKTKRETGAELLSATFNIKASDLTSLLDTERKKKTEEEEEEDEWLDIPDPNADNLLKQTDPEKFALKLKRREYKKQQMEMRYQKCKAWVLCFWEQLQSPEMGKLIRDRNEDLFLKEEIYRKIAWFQDVNWIFGLEVDEKGQKMSPVDTKGNPLSVEDYPRTTASAYEEIIIIDQMEEESLEKRRKNSLGQKFPDFKPLRTEIWFRLNNALLLAEVEMKVEDESLEKLLQFLRDLYDDVESGKVAKISEIPTLIIQKIQTTMPMFDVDSSMRLFDFILEAVFQNVPQFRAAFSAAQEYLPKELLSMAKNYGYDLVDLDVNKFVDTQVKSLTQLRTNRQQIIQNGGSVQDSIRETIPAAAAILPSNGMISTAEIGQLANTMYQNLTKKSTKETAPIIVQHD